MRKERGCEARSCKPQGANQTQTIIQKNVLMQINQDILKRKERAFNDENEKLYHITIATIHYKQTETTG